MSTAATENQTQDAQKPGDKGEESIPTYDVVLKVRRPEAGDLAHYRRGAAVIAIMDPYGQDEALQAMAGAGLDAFAMELMPRITRAQVMDVLSSQANLAGYRAVIDAATYAPTEESA